MSVKNVIIQRVTETGPPKLKRDLNTVSLTFYGLGGILGAGIYALIGEIAGIAGTAAWLAFLVSFLTASLTGLSYCELAARFPKSAGESVYLLAAFRKKSVSYLVGFFVFLTGIVSTGALSHAFAGYLEPLAASVPKVVWIIGFVSLLSAITYWGIKESSWFNIVCTVIEIIGILIVILAGMRFLGSVDYWAFPQETGSAMKWVIILNGAMVAFYAFVGFEDIVNAAEETHAPTRVIPAAILISLGVAAVLYVLTALVAVSTVPVKELASSPAPLALVVQRGWPQVPGTWFTFIALFAIANSALINFIMSSRLLYGMAREGLVPQTFGQIHPKRRTPHHALMLVFLTSLLLSLSGGLALLAESTSFLILVIFVAVNLSLIRIKIRDPKTTGFQTPIGVPVLGIVSSLGLLSFVNPASLGIVVLLVAVGLLFFFLSRKHG